MKILKGSPAYFKLIGQWAEKTPTYCMMNLQTQCRYSCPKCALDEGCKRVIGTTLSLSESKRIITLAHQAGAKCLVVIGMGEPTDVRSFPIVRPVIEHAFGLGMVTILFTTLYGLNKEQAEFYEGHSASLYISLDSINHDAYRFLTGNGKLDQILQNINVLRSLFRPVVIDGQTVVRLGINTTVVRQNVGELEQIRQFAGDDVHYVANVPMHRGRLDQNGNWDSLVGNDYDLLATAAQVASETGSHSSAEGGICSYFFRGIAVDVDGQMLTCGYAAETAAYLPHCSELHSTDDVLAYYRRIQSTYRQFAESVGRVPSCPLRDEKYPQFAASFDSSPFKILHNGNS
jgi:MoaA/NifB/PqqE/SkfB family radical SAM enzyme